MLMAVSVISFLRDASRADAETGGGGMPVRHCREQGVLSVPAQVSKGSCDLGHHSQASQCPGSSPPLRMSSRNSDPGESAVRSKWSLARVHAT